MLRPILIVVLVTLAKLHFGDGVGQGPQGRYGSFRSRYPTAPAPASAPAPAPASIRSSLQRPLSPSRSSRFDTSSIPQQSPALTQSRSFNSKAPSTPSAPAPWRPRFGNMGGSAAAPQPPPSRTQSASGADATQFLPPGFLQSLGAGRDRGRDDPQWGPLVPNINPGVYMVEIGPDGQPINPLPPGYHIDPNSSPMDIDEYIANEKRKEEENDPDSHKINTDGEIIEQQLPTGGGDIVIKISGTNITQRKMNKLREFLKKSIDFVFENTQSKSALKARYM